MQLHNFGGELLQAACVVTPRVPDEVRGAVLRARAEGRSIRPLGSRFTIGDISSSDDLALVTDQLPKALRLMTPPSGRRLVRVPASSTIAEVSAFLRPRGLMLEATPNFTGVSFVGACATSSHGASVHHAPLGACIRAFEIVDGLGRHRFITRDGDAEVVPEGEEADCAPGLFDALLVHLGSVAIVLSVVIEPETTFFITEEREAMDWRAARRVLASDTLEAVDTLAVLACPYAVLGERRTVVSRQMRHATRPGLHAAGADSPAQMALMYLTMLRAMVSFRLSPSTIPERLGDALPVFMSERRAEGEGHTFMGTDYMGLPPRGIALELAIPFDPSSPRSRATMVDRLDEIFEEIEAARARGRYVGGYLSIRFGKRWDAPLSLTFGSDTCFVEILVVDGTPRQRDVLRDLEEAMRPRRLRRHMGLLHHHAPGELATLYPRRDAWLEARNLADPSGIFVGPYARKNQLGAAARGWAEAAE